MTEQSLSEYKTTEVFVPGGMPLYTYIPRQARSLEDQLREGSNNLCKLITLTGMTKAGKTVLANKVFPRYSSIWIDGGTIREEDDLWNVVLDELEGFSSVSMQTGSSRGAKFAASVDVTAGLPLFAQAKGKGGAEYSGSRAKSETRSREISPRAAAIGSLRERPRPVVIDDFHYLDRDLQGKVVRAVKPLIFEGLPIVLIAIPHRKYDAVKVEREITGRLQTIPIPAWEIDELLLISEKGFELLNVGVLDDVTQRLAQESYGSPHLMQEFCRSLAKDHGIDRTRVVRYEIHSVDDSLFSGVAQSTGRVMFDRLATGPRQRTDRVQRPLKDGGTVDIYGATLLALSKLQLGLETIEYEQLRAAMRDVLADKIPGANEVTRVLEKMSEIASSDESSTPVIDWEKEEQKLHITDPFFAFFLRWGMEEAKGRLIDDCPSPQLVE